MRSCYLFIFCLLLAAPVSASLSQAPETRLFHLRLVDRLDRPEDGYCFDILGVGANLRTDLPLFAHNCKPVLTNDSAVLMLTTGQIIFPAVKRCVTVAGVNSRALPGAALLLRDCDEAAPFFEAGKLQQFSLQADGRLTLAGTGLCIAVGARSDSTYSPHDRWRALFVDDCDRIDASRARWELVVPGD